MTPDAELQIFAVKRGQIKGKEIFCSALYPYYLIVIEKYQASKYNRGLLKDFVDVNPPTCTRSLSDQDVVSFIPMSAVECLTNSVEYESVEYNKVKKGFTIFSKGDLLWAKITPCMQNGKSCLTDQMPTEIGFGSTEFHVLRVKKDKMDSVYMPFLWVLFSNKNILKAAQAVFNGSAGQQRVSDSFFNYFPAVLPDYSVQKDMFDRLNNKLVNYKCKLCQANELLAGMDEFITNHIGLAKSDFSKHRMCWGIKRMDLNPRRLDALFYMPSSCDKFNSHHECRLADIAILNSNSKKNIMFSENVPYVGLPECSSNGIISIEKKKYKEVSGRNIAIPGDILFARIEPSIFNKKYVWTDNLHGHEYVFLSTEFYTIRAIDFSLQKFIYAMLFYPAVYEQFFGKTVGSTGRRRLDKRSLEDVIIPMPDIEICKAIGEEFFRRQKMAEELKLSAEKEWQSAREQFEKELLGE